MQQLLLTNFTIAMIKLSKKSSNSLIKELYYDPERKSLIQIFYDLLTLTFYHGKFPRHYFSRYLFKKGKTNIKDYIPNDILYKKFKPFFNDKEVRDLVENKLYFDFYFNQFNINLPKILMYNHKKLFVINKKSIEVNNPSEFKVLLDDIFNQNISIESIIIKRTYGSYGGDKVYKLFRQQIAADSELINMLFTEVVKAGFLFQKTVQQHPQLNVLNPSSLNTIRFDSFIDKDGKIEVVSGYIRMSITNQHVDNISSGGCMVGINIHTGKLKREGYMSITKFGVKVLTKHPITNIVFEDFTIPYFDEAKNLVIKAARLMPGLRLMGWDLAIGESGPVLIEGNSDYNMRGNDLSEGGFHTNPVFRKVLKELNYL